MVSEGLFMSSNQSHFDTIRQRLVEQEADVALGKMMSSEAITYKKKVFAFCHDESMCFKLGRNFDLEKYGITEYSVLSPFKNKAPMRDWFYIPQQNKWDELAQIALKQMQEALA